jgi:hypothetical protein
MPSTRARADCGCPVASTLGSRSSWSGCHLLSLSSLHYSVPRHTRARQQSHVLTKPVFICRAAVWEPPRSFDDLGRTVNCFVFERPAYIEARPERMKEGFGLLANEAMAKAWPCKN